jgi:isopenicillin N synthase-like dioxygenase
VTGWTNVSLAGLTAVGGEQADNAASRLAKALTEDGACLLELEPTILDACPAICAEAQLFFAQAPADKAPLAARPGWPMGWYPLVNDQGQPRERLLIAGVAGQDALAAQYSAYPPQFPALLDQVPPLHAKLDAIGRLVIAATARVTGGSAAEQVAHFDRPGGAGLWLMHYPPVSAGAATQQQGATAHTDLHPLVLIYQNEPDLEAWIGGQWIAAPVSDSQIVCLWGDSARLLWGQGCVAGLHRVTNRPDRTRLSICAFFHPKPTTPMGSAQGATASTSTWQQCLNQWQESLGQ